ncbi:MAG: glycosyltransferase family 4 protein [candidate division NC10 bacterium]|nr:glycosyltransferase family 4 protein [candidate division NC10 bacterium]
MEVGIDALPLMGRGGISRHLRDLLPALVARGPGYRYHLFARVLRSGLWKRYREAADTFASPHLRWHRIFLPDRLLEFAWTNHDLVLPGTGRCLKGLDIFLATAGLAPAGAPCPIVGVVHDLVPLKFPYWFPSDAQLIRGRLEKLVARSRLLIAVSESTRRDLQDLLGVPGEKVRVVHHGIHPRFAPLSGGKIRPVLAARRVSGPFFLYVGGLGPVKNVRTLLEAFGEFRQRAASPHELLLAGDPRWAGALPSVAESLGLGGAVRFLGFVEDDELPALYAGATSVILPSWHESFGFPALEAMACGTIVLAARVGALPDLLGDAAIFFPPGAPSQLAEHMARVSTDEDLRRDLGARGRARAASFTWERAAAETLEVLREARSSDGRDCGSD